MVVLTFGFTQKSVREVSAVLGRTRAAVSDLRPCFTAWLPNLVGCLTSNFLNQGTVDGSWAPLTKATLERKQKAGQIMMILVATGQMMRAATQRGVAGNVYEMDPLRMVWGVDMRKAGFSYNYAYVHDVLGVVRKGGDRVVREFMVLDKPTITELERNVARRIKAVAKGTVVE